MVLSSPCRPSSSFTRSSTGLSVLPHDLPPPPSSVPTAEVAKRKTNETVRRERSRLFDRERERQMSLLPRVEKIRVRFSGAPLDADKKELAMNKHLSTPYNVAQRENRLK